MGFGFHFPSPSRLLTPPKPPMPPFVPAPIAKATEKAYNIMAAPIRSTIAADPLLSWAETGHFTPHNKRTRAGVHELYKEDRLAQRLGVREKDVVTVVEVAQVVVAIYFGGSFLAGGSTAGAGAGAATTGGGVLAGVSGAVETASTVVGLAGTVKSITTKPKAAAPDASQTTTIAGEQTKPADQTSAGGVGLLGALALGAALIL